MKNYRVRHGCHSCVHHVVHDGKDCCTQVRPAAVCAPAGICDDWVARAVSLAAQREEQNPGLPSSRVNVPAGKGGMSLFQPTVLVDGKEV